MQGLISFGAHIFVGASLGIYTAMCKTTDAYSHFLDFRDLMSLFNKTSKLKPIDHICKKFLRVIFKVICVLVFHCSVFHQCGCICEQIYSYSILKREVSKTKSGSSQTFLVPNSKQAFKMSYHPFFPATSHTLQYSASCHD